MWAHRRRQELSLPGKRTSERESLSVSQQASRPVCASAQHCHHMWPTLHTHIRSVCHMPNKSIEPTMHQPRHTPLSHVGPAPHDGACLWLHRNHELVCPTIDLNTPVHHLGPVPYDGAHLWVHPLRRCGHLHFGTGRRAQRHLDHPPGAGALLRCLSTSISGDTIGLVRPFVDGHILSFVVITLT